MNVKPSVYRCLNINKIKYIMIKKIIKYLRSQEWNYHCPKCKSNFSSTGWGICPNCYNRFTKELGKNEKV